MKNSDNIEHEGCNQSPVTYEPPRLDIIEVLVENKSDDCKTPDPLTDID